MRVVLGGQQPHVVRQIDSRPKSRIGSSVRPVSATASAIQNVQEGTLAAGQPVDGGPGACDVMARHLVSLPDATGPSPELVAMRTTDAVTSQAGNGSSEPV